MDYVSTYRLDIKLQRMKISNIHVFSSLYFIFNNHDGKADLRMIVVVIIIVFTKEGKGKE